MARFQDKNGVVAAQGFFQQIPGTVANSVTGANYYSTGVEAVLPITFGTTSYTVLVPSNAFVVSFSFFGTTAFNAGSTNQVKIGSTAGAADLYALTTLPAAGASSTTTCLAPTAATGKVFVTLSLTGTAASTGAGYIVVKYLNTYPTITNAAL